MAFQDMHKFIDGIVNALFAPDNRRLQGWVDQLCKQNQEVRKEPQCYGFLYGGEFYRQGNFKGYIHDKRSIDPSLYPQVDAFLKDKRIVDTDKAFIRQGLFAILEPCKTVQDIRDTLPECLADLVANSNQYQRTREPAFTIQDDPRAIRQFTKVLPTMEAYAAARFIF